MLKSIEISGFKSFADPTRLEFSEGISALVGPNGSGKSNIVDAIKWVLGEQSSKKLRASESTDVIFNGSASRPPLGTAEVTLTFTNENRTFDIDAKEVHLTRRIYRSGEGEYLINRRTGRLKDIKDIISGSGLGGGGYSIIEQGRVEALLQSTALQRRVIFEEAAGIARFSAKKQEAERRLERVTQNLLRLSDTVNELESQLRQTKSQAGKAEVYRQHHSRLLELRTTAGTINWYQCQVEKSQIEDEQEQLIITEARLFNEIKWIETDWNDCRLQVEANESRAKLIGQELAAVREKIHAVKSARTLYVQQSEQLEDEIVAHGLRITNLHSRSGDTQGILRQTQGEIIDAQRLVRESSQSWSLAVKELEKSEQKRGGIQALGDTLQQSLQKHHRSHGRLVGEISGHQTRLEKPEEMIVKLEEAVESHQAEQKRWAAQEEKLTGEAGELLIQVQGKRSNIKQLQSNKSQLQQRESHRRKSVGDACLRQSRMTERASLLKDLLQRQEGLSPGVKEVLRNREQPDSPFRFVHGLVADLIRVNIDAAPLIELVLGPIAAYVVASPEPELIEFIETQGNGLAGRVGFVWLDSDTKAKGVSARGKNYENEEGVIGRADQFVETDGTFEKLITRLLSNTWIVESLAHARIIQSQSDGRTDFLTISGEYLLGTGTMVVGPANSGSGLIAWRSELRDLADSLSDIELVIHEGERELTDLEKAISEIDTQLEEIQNNAQSQNGELETLLRDKAVARQQKEHFSAQYHLAQGELSQMIAEKQQLEEQLQTLRLVEATLTEKIQRRESQSRRLQEVMQQHIVTQTQQQLATTDLKIALAKGEERLDALRAKRDQFEETQKERIHLLQEHRKQLDSLKERREQLELTLLKTQSQLAELYAKKDVADSEQKKITGEQQQQQNHQIKSQERLKKSQSEVGKVREKIQRNKMDIERIAQEQRTVTDRMKEDYGIDLHRELLSQFFIPEESEEENEESQGNNSRQADKNFLEEKRALLPGYQREIDQIRRKIDQLGSVNLQAIEMLESLESRYNTKFNQYNDLVSAKKSILKLMERINKDNKRLFEETLDSIRVYFGETFRKLFGGGFADLILENPESPLESGVEIVVRPPGKELKNITLLSGGEKTLTCVALLLAIFQYRSNPVCILDEVDAALDESNIGRFAKVLQTLQGNTQFIIVTHSRKTMTAAKQLFGVTMQDSGVSTLIAVQFDEVGENGEIVLKKELKKQITQQDNAA